MRHLADGLASLANPIGGPVDKVRVGLFRLKSLVGDTYGALQAPETSTMRQLQVTIPPPPPPPLPCAVSPLTSRTGPGIRSNGLPAPAPAQAAPVTAPASTCRTGSAHFPLFPAGVELHCSGCHDTLPRSVSAPSEPHSPQWLPELCEAA